MADQLKPLTDDEVLGLDSNVKPLSDNEVLSLGADGGAPSVPPQATPAPDQNRLGKKITIPTDDSDRVQAMAKAAQDELHNAPASLWARYVFLGDDSNLPANKALSDYVKQNSDRDLTNFTRGVIRGGYLGTDKVIDPENAPLRDQAVQTTPGKIGRFVGNVATYTAVPGAPLVQGGLGFIQGFHSGDQNAPVYDRVKRGLYAGATNAALSGIIGQLGGEKLGSIVQSAAPTVEAGAQRAAGMSLSGDQQAYLAGLRRPGGMRQVGKDMIDNGVTRGASGGLMSNIHDVAHNATVAADRVGSELSSHIGSLDDAVNGNRLNIPDPNDSYRVSHGAPESTSLWGIGSQPPSIGDLRSSLPRPSELRERVDRNVFAPHIANPDLNGPGGPIARTDAHVQALEDKGMTPRPSIAPGPKGKPINPDVVDFSDLHQTRRNLDTSINWTKASADENSANQLRRSLRGEVSDYFNDKATAAANKFLDPGSAQQFLENNRLYGSLATARDMAQESSKGLKAGSWMHPIDYSRDLTRSYAAPTSANVLRATAQKMALVDPLKWGRVGQLIAASSNPEVDHFILSQQNADYADAYKKAQEQDDATGLTKPPAQ